MKKINFKRIIALICSVTMLLSLMCVNVSAVDVYNIDTTQKGSFTINKTNGAGNKDIGGVEFKSIKVAEMVQYTVTSNTATTTQLLFYLTTAGKTVFADISSNIKPEVESYTIGEETVALYTATQLQSYLDSLSQTDLVSTMNTFTADDGVMTLITDKDGEASTGTGLSLGIYIVVETDNSQAYVGDSLVTEDDVKNDPSLTVTAVDVESAAAPYLVAIPQTYTNPDTGTDEWIYDITTTPKNIIKAKDAVKYIVETDTERTTNTTSSNYSVGDDIDFIIQGDITASSEHSYTSYVVTDTPTGITYGTLNTTSRSSFAKVTLHSDENDTTGQVLTYETDNGGDYSITFTTDNNNITGFTLTFLSAGLEKLNAATSGTAYLTIEYSGKVVSATTVKNAATINYSYGDGIIPDNPPDVEVTPHKITLNKLFVGNGGTPTDVYFELSDEKGATIYVTKSTNGNYVVDTSLDDNSTDAIDEMQLAINTGATTQGILVVEGLADGTYYLTEVATSTGYSLLAEPIEVTISGNDITLDVTNEESTIFNLPVTGGLGSLVYTAIGLGCICLAVFMVTKLGRKKKFQ